MFEPPIGQFFLEQAEIFKQQVFMEVHELLLSIVVKMLTDRIHIEVFCIGVAMGYLVLFSVVSQTRP